jgi:hypothetical protein
MAEDGPPVVTIPERLDRRMRLGPFPSGRDALKFVTYAAGSAVLLPFGGATLWLPTVGVAFLLSVWRPDGEPLDRRVLAVARWKWRTLRGAAGPMTPVGLKASAALLRLPDGRHAGVLRTAGVPLAYLPPAELARRFERFRELLRALEGGLQLRATLAPIHARSFLPDGPDPTPAEQRAREGYAELVTLIARRRSVRQVYLVRATAGPGAEAAHRLEAELGRLAERLAGLGLAPLRLRDRALRDGAQRIGLLGAAEA